MRVLIADVGPIATMTLGIILRSHGHQVWSVLGGAHMAETVRSFRPHLVMLDLEMPDRSGYEVAEELSREYGLTCPVLIAVTAYRTAEAKARAESSGLLRIVTKPYDPQEPLALVNAFEITLNNAERAGKLAPAFALG